MLNRQNFVSRNRKLRIIWTFYMQNAPTSPLENLFPKVQLLCKSIIYICWSLEKMDYEMLKSLSKVLLNYKSQSWKSLVILMQYFVNAFLITLLFLIVVILVLENIQYFSLKAVFPKANPWAHLLLWILHPAFSC